jgi:hypothetical protein
MPEQQQKEQQPAPWHKGIGGPDAGPVSPNINKPDTSKLLKKMQSIDRKSGERYRQRQGQ